MIYLDNSATSWPKPKTVYSSMMSFMEKNAANPGRSGHSMAIKASETIYECREKVAAFFNIDNSSNVIFTLNATDALNLAIKGTLKKGDHVIFSSMEHNSVIRPIMSLAEKGVEYSIADGDVYGFVKKEEIEKYIKPNTKLIAITHCSNVCGTVNDIYKIGKMAREKGILFLVDASQSAGIIPIDVEKNCIDFLACPGHKAMYGPSGTGLLYVRNPQNLATIKEGGTGSYSKNLFQPEEMPDKFESGTLNSVGICGLLSGINFINQIGIDQINSHDIELAKILLEDLSAIKNIKIAGYLNTERRLGVVSFYSNKADMVSVSNMLSEKYDIATRAGYHCAYLAHKTLGTEKTGTIRLSVGAFNTKKEVKLAAMAINKCINN